ncbi:hypothetical protein SDC9_202119 [bioreactor metagenome]|uniref:Uncharacterized protein n=1 Tax=bioreactor metagenome TaxID=1076179 RepID=A0A645IVJ8_9ZZZZ
MALPSETQKTGQLSPKASSATAMPAIQPTRPALGLLQCKISMRMSTTRMGKNASKKFITVKYIRKREEKKMGKGEGLVIRDL